MTITTRATPADTAGLEVRLLGAVEASRAGVLIDLGGPRPRTILALLALRRGMPVPADRLIDALWPDEGPDAPSGTLRAYVSRLRTALGDDAINHSSGGYTLQLDAEAVDAVYFEQLVRDATAALERRRYAVAAELLDEALGHWGGDPFGSLGSAEPLRAETVRLAELRLHALEQRFDARLELGKSAELVDELEALVAENPYRERLWRQPMLALYRADRQADALAAYHRARTAVDAELGIEPGEELRALEGAILRQEVATPAATRGDARSVPIPLTRFIGREADVATIVDRMRTARLVTLVGVGGTGKTRLALEVGRRLEDRFADGAAFVDLAAIREPSLVASHIAEAVEVGAGPEDAADRLVARLRTADMLLILDNCEHLRDAVAALAERLLAAGRDVRILATSREVLGVPGEVDHAVQPLQAPSPDASIDELLAADGVRLLLDRSRPGVATTDVDAEMVRAAARICRELDGLPLAIELAAARSTALTFDEIADKLSDRFRFLVSWRRLAPARHQTLRQAMDWSFDLLGPDEARLFLGLSVFGGSFRLESVAAVCLDGDADMALTLVERLVRASLLNALRTDRGVRFRLLETVRQYAADRLEPDQGGELRRRLAEHVRAIAYDTHLIAESPGHPDYETVDAELPNIRVALAWAVEHDPPLGVDIATLLERLWAVKAAQEGLTILGALLERHPIPDPLRARALRAVGGLRWLSGDREGGLQISLQSLELYRALADNPAAGHVMLRIGMVLSESDPEAARTMVANGLATAGPDHYAEDDYLAPGVLANAEYAAGNLEAALALIREAAEAAARHDDPWWETTARGNTAAFALMLGRPGEAAGPARECLRLARRLGGRRQLLHAFALLSEEAAQVGQDRRAGRLWGAVLGEMQRGTLPGQGEAAMHRRELRIRATMGPEFEAGVLEGQKLSPDEAYAEGLSASDA
jgi:predicted ATPase/DNA-binding SARP family transcriptional activator